MPYTYKYIPASQAAQAQGSEDEPKNQYVELFQETLNEQFFNSTDWFEIEEETYAGSDEYKDVDVRIVHVVDTETGLNLGDDWKNILFKDLGHELELGKHYRFDDNIWLTVNTEFIKNIAASCIVRRCNNAFRWIDETTGAFYSAPCCIKYEVKEPRDYATAGSPFMTPGGFLHMWTQFNDRTNLIKENQRFLFGNSGHWTCWKVVGTGLNDYRNDKTFDNTSPKLLVVDLSANFVNDELDDVVNGIADVYTNLYSLTLNRATAESSVGNTIQLTTNITYNGDTVTRPVTWETSNVYVATVSTTGLVTCVHNGTCTITASITGNPESDTCTITVKASPAANLDVVFTPNLNYVLEGDSTKYGVYKFTNGATGSEAFTFTLSPHTIPPTSYKFTQNDSHHFTIENKLRDVDSYLTVNYGATGVTGTFDIYLRGAWLNDSI